MDEQISLNDIVIVDMTVDGEPWIVYLAGDDAPLLEPVLSLCRHEPLAGDPQPGIYAKTVGSVVMLHVG